MQFKPYAHALKVFEGQIKALGDRGQCPDLFDDIYKACEKKQAFLFVSESGNSLVVLKPLSKQVMLVWLALGGDKAVIPSHIEFVKARARDVGATHLEYETPFPAVERYCKRFGWQRHGTRKHYSVWRLPL